MEVYIKMFAYKCTFCTSMNFALVFIPYWHFYRIQYKLG